MSPEICEVDLCENECEVGTKCRMHYFQLWKQQKSEMCLYCDGVVLARKMCQRHYRQFRKNNKELKKCIIDDCINLIHAKGYCSNHYARFRQYGDPYIVKKRSGPRPHIWKENASYTAVHNRLRRTRGSATLQKCIDCGKSAAHWSLNKQYDHTYALDKGVLLPVSYDLNHYDPRCRSCHTKYDINMSKVLRDNRGL